MNEALNFRIENKRYKVCIGMNKLRNAKSRNVLASKCYFTGEGYLVGNIEADGRAIGI